MSSEKIWSGRFTKSVDALMQEFSVSLDIDQHLFDADIAVNKAWAGALCRTGIYTDAQTKQVRDALNAIQKDYHEGKLTFPDHAEDIHSANEHWLTERLGETGARIHTGRSRNDQVVTDLKLYLKEKNLDLQQAILILQSALTNKAEEHRDTVLPGQTHLRQAQPISFAHYLLSFFFQLQRDVDRLNQAFERCDSMPLGAGAIAGAGFDIDRIQLAKELGFSRITENSYDATSDRDYVNDLLFCCSQIMVHISRMAEDLIIVSSEGYRFVELDELFSTGSSMMPQKKNPDSLELIRGKTARVIGNQVSGLTLLKGAPTAYVRDLQEDKAPVFDSLYQTTLSVRILAGVVETLAVFPDRMRAALTPDLFATDMADYLVRKGMPFRQAHRVIGKIVANAEQNGTALNSLSLDIMKRHSELIDADIYECFNPQNALKNRNIAGGTGPVSIEHQIKKARELLKQPLIKM
ncbi:MAG: argininosuccinate lyase [candidate division KSB1 bacterium]|nr:argininosuccinate lyase [candidate division KSB1 bacterium]